MLRAMVDSNYRLTGYEPGDLASDLIAQEQVLQPPLPVRLPCYDFTLVALLALVEAPLFTSQGERDPAFGCDQLPWCDGRCVQGPGTNSPLYS